ncbi:hypothetical protein [Myceligenerans salitolerans]|uniref:YqaJ viral recombinase domain-containing protein n=1 Tax=Myceligenerans salitolerans TaxID=1230528 RepID=A0ABS3ICU8_9MICO|nr:hypothetical protein [Myceligenerans salitolerans]MBO0609872.1 hypothetical protein [Myceligenerans salitolerans]
MAKTIWDQLADDAEFLLATLDPSWVDEQVANVRSFEDKLERSGGRLKGSRTFHPLAVNVSNYQAAPDGEAAYKSMGKNFLRLARAGNALRTLAGVPGLDERVKNLTRGDGALHYSTEFELISAAVYVSTGHSVEFVPETDTPTFDRLVDGTVEVECKQATPFTRQQLQAASLWTLLDRQIRKALDRHEGVFYVHATVPDLPDQDLIADILAEVKQLADKDAPSASQTHGDVQYHYMRKQPKRLKDRSGFGGDIPHWFPGQADHLKIEASAIVESSGTMDSGKLHALAFDSRKPHPDPGQILVDQLRKAKPQFTGNRPAVIHADITGALGRSRLQLGDTEVANEVREWLQRHGEVTAVQRLRPAI